MNNNSSPPSPSDDNVEAFRKALADAAERHTGLPRADVEALVDNTRAAGPRNYAMRARWVYSLARVTKAIVLGEAKPFDLFAAAFWLRLQGAMTELPAQFTSWQKMTAEHQVTMAPGLLKMLRLEQRVHERCVALAPCLTERELFYVALARHTEAHVTQSGFDYGFEGRKKKQPPRLRKTTRVAALGTDHDAEYIHRQCRALEAEHGGDVEALTISIARKVSRAVLDLYLAMREFNEVEP